MAVSVLSSFIHALGATPGYMVIVRSVSGNSIIFMKLYYVILISLYMCDVVFLMLTKLVVLPVCSTNIL